MENYTTKFIIPDSEDQELSKLKYVELTIYSEINNVLALYSFDMHDIGESFRDQLSDDDKLNEFETFVNNINANVSTCKLQFMQTNGSIAIEKNNNIMTFRLSAMCNECLFNIKINQSLIDTFNQILDTTHNFDNI